MEMTEESHGRNDLSWRIKSKLKSEHGSAKVPNVC